MWNPSEHGWNFIGEIDWNNEPWEFYCTVVYKKGRKYLAGTDSGCSCPIPFEDHSEGDYSVFTKVGDLRTHLNGKSSGSAKHIQQISSLMDTARTR